MSKDAKRCTYTLFAFHDTAAAIMVGKEKSDRENDKAFWLPLSQVEVVWDVMSPDGTRSVSLEVPDWLAERCGLDPSLDGEDEPPINEVIDDE